jgi:hypothetical protein
MYITNEPAAPYAVAQASNGSGAAPVRRPPPPMPDPAAPQRATQLTQLPRLARMQTDNEPALMPAPMTGMDLGSDITYGTENEYLTSEIQNLYAMNQYLLDGSSIVGLNEGEMCIGLRPHGMVSQWLFDNMTVFGGTRVFNDDINLRHRGTFASHSGINWSAPFIIPLQLSAQFGFRAVQSNFNKDSLVPGNYFSEYSDQSTRIPYRDQMRSQYYLTTGLFKRFSGFPLQFGAVYDWCWDDAYQSFRFGQIRAEASVWTQRGLELGGRTAVYAGSQDVQFRYVDSCRTEPQEYLSEYRLQTQGYYMAYVKKYHEIGANAMLYGGSTYSGGFLCGAEYEIPGANCITLQSGFSALFRDKAHQVTNEKRENWDVFFSIVYYPHGRAFNDIRNPLRAMFSVADPGSMKPEFIHRRTVPVP